MLPIDLTDIVEGIGERMRPARDLGPLANYWKQLGPQSRYHVSFANKAVSPYLLQQTGGQMVGGFLRIARGGVLLLPQPTFDTKGLGAFAGRVGWEWNEAGISFGKGIAALLAGLADGFLAPAETTAPPAWALQGQFELPPEANLKSVLAERDAEVARAEAARDHSRKELEEVQQLRRLLFAKGSELESAVMRSLVILGFTVTQQRNPQSDFDVVFESPEGRCLGEAEGKDNAPISVGKLRQLNENIDEDREREEVAEPAKGVLFGNAFRLSPLNERPNFFGEKCIAGARRSSVALVRTPDLFKAASAFLRNNDK